MKITDDHVNHPITDRAGKLRPPEEIEAAFRERDLRVAQRELRTIRRAATAYRWLALAGWALAITALSVPRAQADTLPVGSLACDNALAYEAQMLTFSDATLIADPGCVFTDRDLTVYVVSGNEVFVGEIGFSVWADVEVLQ